MDFMDLKQEIDEVIDQKELDKLIYETEKSFGNRYDIDTDFDDDLDFEF